MQGTVPYAGHSTPCRVLHLVQCPARGTQAVRVAYKAMARAARCVLRAARCACGAQELSYVLIED